MKCPVCNKNLEMPVKDLKEGIYYDCDHCHSSLFFQGEECKVLVEGSLEQTEQQALEEPPELTEVPALSVPEEEVSDSEESETKDSLLPEEEEEEEEEEESKPEENNLEDSPLPEEVSDSEESETKDSLLPEEELEQEEAKDNLSEVQNETEEQALEDFSEVTEFGNKKGLGEEGVFYYNLTLSEINSEEVRREVENILKDEALKIDSEKNNLKIEDGVLKILEISPVKIHAIVKSLIGLPVKISWEQHLVVDKT